MGTLQSVARAATVMQSNRRSNPQVQPSDDVDDPEHERPREWASCRRSCSLDTSAKAHLVPAARLAMAQGNKDPPS